MARSSPQALVDTQKRRDILARNIPKLWEFSRPMRRYNGVMAGYKNPPKNRQFGAVDGNPRGKGFFKKELTPRYQMEELMRLTEAELRAVIEDESQPLFKRRVAQVIDAGEWKPLEGMINQVYGTPKQQVALEAPMPKPLIDLTKPD